jgi:hypothetical protein
MAHQIEENDVTFSTEGKEWMGLAVVKTPAEMREAMEENLFFPVIEAPAVVTIEGENVELKDEDGKGWKVILADCRNLPICEGREKHPASFVPLHIPKTGYNPLENEVFFEALESALDRAGIKYEITTAGTLGNLAYFYFSLDLMGAPIKGARGEDLKAYLSGVTSHNGVLVPRFKDSWTRPVCMNTVQGMLRETSALDVVGKHTANGLESIENMAQIVESFFTGTERLEKEIFPRLQSQEATVFEMREIAAGYFALPALENKKSVSDFTFSTQARNAIDGIVTLARHGAGNAGETLYDLFNGATDYWSNGSGVGSEKVSMRKKVYKARFGAAAEHKTAFSEYLFDSDKVSKGREFGKVVLENTAKALN